MKKTSFVENLSELGFKEAALRLIRSASDDIAENRQRVAKEVGEIERNVEENRRNIRSGGRSFKHPFRP